MKIVVLLIAFLSAAVSASGYRCEEVAGKISYSDVPCVDDSQNKVVQDNTGKSAKKYNGFNQEKYLELSKEKRDEICASKKCII